MDDSPLQARRPGGTVEPAKRAPIAKARFQTPDEPVGTRYELRDPFAEVTYRVKTFDDMVAKAEQLGASRFVEIGAEGQRTVVNKIDGIWQRPANREQPPPEPRRDEATTVKIVPSAVAAPPAPEGTIARIDAEAERAALVQRLETALNERYIIKRASVKLGDATVGRNEYRFRGDTSRVAFTESTFRLATDTNSPSVARSMVDVAEARNWHALRVSGHEDFKRMVWLEASARGVKTIGYEPVPGDLELLRKEQEGRAINRIEPLLAQASDVAGAAAGKQSARGNGGRKAVLAALDAVLVAKRVPEKQRVAVMAAAEVNLAKRLAAGERHQIKVFDKAAPSQRPMVPPTREVQRAREQTAPVR